MASNNSSKVCEAERKACKKDAQALCYHCSKNLCRVHLMQHAQLIEEKTRAELHSLADKFNELSSRFNDLSVSDDILQKPLDQLEKWRTEAHKKIDQMAENKRRELSDELYKYRGVFLRKNEEQSLKLEISKKKIAELIQEADASTTQITNLQQSIDEAEKYLNALNAPVINVIARSLNWSVDISTNFFDGQATFVNKIREFKITYVRLNGIIRNYYIKTNENGKMTDLIKIFIDHYTAVEEFTQRETNQVYIVDHLPKPDFILPVEVYNHRVHLQYSETTLLGNILERDIIAFYETPHSLNVQNNPHILMPCLFQRNPGKKSFGWPIFLNVPRKGCRGQDVRDALHNTLKNFFPPDFSAEKLSYDAYLQSPVNYLPNRTKLEDALQDEIDFTKVNVTLMVAFDNQFFDAYEERYLVPLGF